MACHGYVGEKETQPAVLCVELILFCKIMTLKPHVYWHTAVNSSGRLTSER